MNKIATLFFCIFLIAPFMGFGQCSGQYNLTYPSGSSTTTVSINNGTGTISSNYCPTSASSQQSLVVAPSSAGTVSLDRTLDGTTSTLQTYTTVAGGTYTFTLPTITRQAVYTVRSVIGCNNQKNSTVTLTLGPSLTMGATATTVCQGSSSTLTATGSNTGSYTWSAPGMANVVNSGTLTVAPDATTTYTVTAPTACGTATQQQLSVFVPTLTATSSATKVAPGSSVTLTAASNETSPAYTWTTGGNTIGTGASISVSPTKTTTYRVTSSNPSGCANTSFREVTIMVLAPTMIAPLPVELTAFEARWTGTATRLIWATASEKDNAYFEVERSLDGVEFKPVGRQTGAGSSTAPQQYSLVDATPVTSVTTVLYYRLRQVDFSGETQLSPVRVVRPETKATGLTAQVFPNPMEGDATLRLQTSTDGPVTCVMHDALGREVLRTTFQATAGGQQLPLLAGFAPKAGLYYLTVRQGQQQQVLRLQQR